MRSDYPNEPEQIAAAVHELNEAVAEEGIELRVLAGAEVSLQSAAELDDATLASLCLATGRLPACREPVPLERHRPGGDRAGRPGARVPPAPRAPGALPDLPARPVAARPAREQRHDVLDHQRLARGPVRHDGAQASLDLLYDGLVHDVASDAHDHLHRPPDLLSGFESAEADMPGIRGQATWFTVTAPVAIVTGRALPPPHDPPHARPWPAGDGSSSASSRAVRVIHVADYGGPYAGSFVPMLRSVAAAVRERGGSVEAAFTPVARDRPWLAELESDAVPVSFAPAGDRRARARFLDELAGGQDEPAIIHTHFTSFDLPAVTVARARPGTSVFWHVHTRLRPPSAPCGRETPSSSRSPAGG